MADGDLTGGGRIEPGDRLVGADPLGALRPQPLDLTLAELGAPGRARRQHGHVELGKFRGIGARVVQCPGSRGQPEGSNRLIGPMPLRPSSVAVQYASVPSPFGAVTPIPVKTAFLVMPHDPF